MGEMRGPPQVPQALALACSQQKNSLVLGLDVIQAAGSARRVAATPASREAKGLS